MAARAVTHQAPHPFSNQTHTGTYQACTHDHCASHRSATGLLREGQPLTPAEQQAATAIRGAQWALWHADDRDLAVALVLSRAGLLRDTAHEEHMARGAAVDAAHRDRRRRADQMAITALTDLAEEAADILAGGADPQQVAAKLREISASILARRDRRSAPVAPVDDTEPEAVSA